MGLGWSRRGDDVVCDSMQLSFEGNVVVVVVIVAVSVVVECAIESSPVPAVTML